MKLFYISSSILPSKEANSVHVIKIGEAFARQGIDFTLFASSSGQSYSETELFEYYGVCQPFQLAFLPRPKIPALWNLIYALGAVKKTFSLGKPDMFYGRNAFVIFVLSLFFPRVPIAY